MTLFEFVKARLPILDVISEHVKLRAMGSYFKGPCPFHSEKDASFTVSPDRQIFYCFGCQATGDVIGFFARLEHISQIEAVKLLVEHYSLELPPEVQKSAMKEMKDFEKKDQHNNLCQKVAGWAHVQLVKAPRAQKYLIERGITQSTIDKFMLGYFPGGSAHVDQLVKEMSYQGVLLKDLLESGVLLEGKNHLFSPWEERIIFPIKNSLGSYCGFGGRVFQQNDDRAKYINSRESDWFLKGKLLFGFDSAKKAIQQKESVFMVEGYMDCIAMAQYGYENTVATLGTACTLEHLKLLGRQAATIYLLYDGDKAGQNALLRIAQLCWQVSADMKVIVLPNDHDPASFLIQGHDLNPLVAEAQDLFNFFIDQVAEGFLDKPLSKKLVLAEKIIEVLLGIQDIFKQELLLHQAAQTMQVPFDALKRLLVEQRRKKEAKKNSDYTPRSNGGSSELAGVAVVAEQGEKNLEKTEISLLEQKIFSVILNSLDNQHVLKVDDWVIPYLSDSLQHLLITLNEYLHLPDLSMPERYRSFLDSLAQGERNVVVKMSLMADQSPTQGILDDLITQFFKNHWKQMMRDMRDQMKKAEEKADVEAVKVLFGKITELKQRMLSRGLI